MLLDLWVRCQMGWPDADVLETLLSITPEQKKTRKDIIILAGWVRLKALAGWPGSKVLNINSTLQAYCRLSKWR